MTERASLKALLQTAKTAAAPETTATEPTHEPTVSPHTVNQTETRMRQDYGMTKTPQKRAEVVPVAPQPRAGKAWIPGQGKSSNPDYARFTVYVPKKLRIQAERKWQDDTGRDASDLVEHLLGKYLNT